MVAIHLLNKEVAEMWRSVNLRFAQGILLAVFLIYLLTMSTNLKLHNQSIIEHGSQRDGRAVQSDRLQTSQAEESKIGFHTIGKNKTTPDGTDESNFHPEAEMRHNADYTRRVCQSLVGPVAESSIEERQWFYQGAERPSASLTWTSNTDRFSLLFTPIPKCGWTTWQVLFYTDAGNLDDIRRDSRWAWDNDYHDVGLNVTTINKAEYESYRDRLLFVRDPYERLVSAYYDKALHADGLYTKRYHLPCWWLNLTHNFTLKFPQFVDCILNNTKLGDGDQQSLGSRHSSIQLDPHWTPQSHLSVPCRVNYNLIGKYDRFRESSQFMIRRLKLNATLSNENHKRKGKVILEFWYKQLSDEQKAKLQSLYKYDFLLFDFNSTVPG